MALNPIPFPAIATSGLVSNATATAALPLPTTGRQMYATQAAVAGGTATAATTLTATISNISGGINAQGVEINTSQTFSVPVFAAGAGVDSLSGAMAVNFSAPIKAVAGSQLTLTLPAAGAGGTNAQATLIGFQV